MLPCVFLKKKKSFDAHFLLLFNIDSRYITTKCRCYNKRAHRLEARIHNGSWNSGLKARIRSTGVYVRSFPLCWSLFSSNDLILCFVNRMLKKLSHITNDV